jgi:hypothetical protein
MIGEPGSDVLEFKCSAVECERWPIRASNGYPLPFCLSHCEKLPRVVFEELVEFAACSVFDLLRVMAAERLRVKAIHYLLGRRRPR